MTAILHRLTASKMDMHVACPGSLTLPWALSEPGPAALAGTECHRLIADLAYKRTHSPDLLAKTAVDNEWSEAVRDALVHLDGLPNGQMLVEASYAIDVVSNGCVFTGEFQNRNYSGRVCGTADVVLLPSDTTLPAYVIDWKTGKHKLDAAKSLQIATLCAAVALAHKRHAVTGQLVYLGKRGIRSVSSVTLYKFELDKHVATMRDTLAEAEAGISFNPSQNTCRFCPAKTNCDAYASSTEAAPWQASTQWTAKRTENKWSNP